MKRKGWILSMFGAAGMTLGQLQAQDPFAVPTTPTPQGQAGSLFFSRSGETAKSEESKTPTRFRRNAPGQPASESDLKSYYKELFGEVPASEAVAGPGTAAGAARPAASPVVGPMATGASASPQSPTGNASTLRMTAESVVPAGLEAGPSQNKANGIQQVSGSPAGNQARPFPGQSAEDIPTPFRNKADLPVFDLSRPQPQTAPAAQPQIPQQPLPQQTLPQQALPQQSQQQNSFQQRLPVSSFGTLPTSALPASASPAMSPPAAQPSFPALPPAAPPAIPSQPQQPAFPEQSGLPRANPQSSLTTPIPTAARPQSAAGLTITRGAGQQDQRIVPVSHAPAPTPRTASSVASEAPALSIHWRNQGAINVGQECTCELVVKNSGKRDANDVEVEAFFPGTVRLVSSNPAPDVATSHLGWAFDSIPANGEQVITIRMIPLQRGDIDADAKVRFTGRSTSKFSVAEPMLSVTVEGPTETMIGEPATQKIIVSNPGNGIASNIRLLASIPAGLEHSGGDQVELLIGSLNPGESRPISLPLMAKAGGRHLIEIQARGDAGLTRTAGTEIAVIAPSLKAQIAGPGLRYVGRQATYAVSVTNDGAAATDNVRVMYKVPQGLTFVSSDRGTQYDETNRLLSWFVGRMDQGQTVQLNVTMSAEEIGDYVHLVRATSEYGTVSDAQLATKVEGDSSLAVEISDLDDPVEVGSEAAYEVRVKNEGSAPARSVALVCELAPGMTFLRASGPTRQAAQGNAVAFEAVAELAPGDTATYTVFVAVSKPGSLRFRTQLSSESISEPLTSEELTKFYGE